MKKIVSIVLVLALMLSLAACGGKDADTTTAAPVETTEAPVTEAPATDAPATEAPVEGETEAPAADASSLEGIINGIYEKNPVEIMGIGSMGIDLTDTSDDGLWTLNRFTGLQNADMISEAVASESMVGSIAYSLVMVRVTDAANAETVADEMKAGIDTAKWVCVMADDLMVAGKDDVVMLVMINSEVGTAQSFVNAFSAVMGGTDFVK